MTATNASADRRGFLPFLAGLFLICMSVLMLQIMETRLLAVFVGLLTAWFPALVAAFEGQGLVVRAAVSLLAIVPAGVLMGFGFPTGMRLVNAVDNRPTPWFWAVNGAAGVLAASIAVGTSIAFSINASLWIGAACYLLLAPVSLALLRLGRS